ncbi:type I phosphomannose isomerase catalytic subunit [uncultured Fretibacterium sp.]|mgnify:FL=1|uniref:type I phosphomannose isomerase catalytic subunit n=1 Tax=uncultured Fretibacterium sp. TaxID=1678694 RepID=UPI002611ABF1|nr:type I phosphomannose isomerase catalytic subunit [uncultured Fretibacterium sp.]
MGPFAVEPACKDYLWGGTRLRDEWGLGGGMPRVAESWSLSAHPDGDGRVLNGPCAGMTLSSALRQHPQLASPDAPDAPFPLMVKLIDAALPLSIQVHPDDAYAAQHHEGERGKTEMWYVLDRTPGAFLYLGFRRGVPRGEVERRARDGTLPELLRRIEVQPRDAFFIPAGTVHAIGGGILLAEVQQSSNLTYRLFDYGRLGPDGRPRPLHLERALDVAHLAPADPTPPGARPWQDLSGGRLRVLADCPAFRSGVLRLSGACTIPAQGRFLSLLCLAGEASLSGEEGVLAVSRGTSLLIPAGSPACRIEGSAEFLLTSAGESRPENFTIDDINV